MIIGFKGSALSINTFVPATKELIPVFSKNPTFVMWYLDILAVLSHISLIIKLPDPCTEADKISVSKPVL